MIWNKHSKLEGLHAFLGASNYHWLRYDNDTIIARKKSLEKKKEGTELHALAAKCIEKRRFQLDNDTFGLYVNDAINYEMDPEVLLYYSPNAFGTADSISFRNNMLRIHDLKTGETPAKMDQLYIYAAFFCLEYKIKPTSIKIELRIYQNNVAVIDVPDPDVIVHIMDRIVEADKILTKMQIEEGERT